MSNRQISSQLGIPLRTVERYVHELYAVDSTILSDLYDVDTVFAQVRIYLDRICFQLGDVLEIATNKQYDVHDRLEAHHLAGNLAREIVVVYKGSTAAKLVKESMLNNDKIDPRIQEILDYQAAHEQMLKKWNI
jgi:hypothetical protein